MSKRQEPKILKFKPIQWENLNSKTPQQGAVTNQPVEDKDVNQVFEQQAPDMVNTDTSQYAPTQKLYPGQIPFTGEKVAETKTETTKPDTTGSENIPDNIKLDLSNLVKKPFVIKDTTAISESTKREPIKYQSDQPIGSLPGAVVGAEATDFDVAMNQLGQLRQEIDKKAGIIDKTNPVQVADFNQLVNAYNKEIEKFKKDFPAYDIYSNTDFKTDIPQVPQQTISEGEGVGFDFNPLELYRLAQPQFRKEAMNRLLGSNSDIEGAKAYNKLLFGEVGKENTGINRLAGSFMQGAASTTSGTLGFAKYLTDKLGITDPKQRSAAVDNLAGWISEIAPKNPDFIEQLSSGAGSMAVFVPFGVGVTTLSEALASISPKVAYSLGTGAMTVLESMMEAGNVYNETGDPSAAEKDFLANMVLIGVTNKLGIRNEKVLNGIKAKLMGASMEGIQEAGQSIIQYVSEGKKVDWDVVISSGAIGAILGAGFEGAAKEGAPETPIPQTAVPYRPATLQDFLTKPVENKPVAGLTQEETPISLGYQIPEKGPEEKPFDLNKMLATQNIAEATERNKQKQQEEEQQRLRQEGEQRKLQQKQDKAGQDAFAELNRQFLNAKRKGQLFDEREIAKINQGINSKKWNDRLAELYQQAVDHNKKLQDEYNRNNQLTVENLAQKLFNKPIHRLTAEQQKQVLDTYNYAKVKGKKTISDAGLEKITPKLKENKDNAIPEQRTEENVPRTGITGENIPQSSEGMGSGKQGITPAGTQEETKTPQRLSEEEVKPTENKPEEKKPEIIDDEMDSIVKQMLEGLDKGEEPPESEATPEPLPPKSPETGGGEDKLPEAPDNNKNTAMRMFKEGKKDTDIRDALGLKSKADMDMIREWRKEYEKNKSNVKQDNEIQLEIMRKAGIPEEEMPDYALSSVADGKILRSYLDEVKAGDITVDEAVERVKRYYQKMKSGEKEGKFIEQETPKVEEVQPESTSGFVRIPVKDLTTSLNEFQGRGEEYSQQTFNRIINEVKEGTFNESALPPIQIWKNPKTNSWTILGGHSRTAAYRELSKQGNKNFDSINAQIVKANSLEEAKKIAQESNLTAKQTSVENANYFRSIKDKFATKKEAQQKAQDLYGSDWVYTYNISHLNPNGEAFQLLKAFQKSTDKAAQKKVETIADFIGAARAKYPELTDGHEDELFDYLYDGTGKKITNKNDFMDRLDNIVSAFDYSFDKPLNIESKVTKGYNQTNIDNQIADIRGQIKELERERDKDRPTEARLNKISEEIGYLNKELVKLFEQRFGAKDADRNQTDLFADLNKPEFQEELNEQEGSNLTSIEEKADLIEKEADAYEPDQPEQDEARSQTIEQIDDAIGDIDEELKLLGYYDNRGEKPNQVTENGSKLPEQKFKADLKRFAKELMKGLGYEPHRDGKGRDISVSTNIAPVGGDGRIVLWKPNSDYGVYISVPVDQDVSGEYLEESKNNLVTLQMRPGRFLWRVTTKDNVWTGLANQWVNKDITAGEFARMIKKAVDQAEAEGIKKYTPQIGSVEEQRQQIQDFQNKNIKNVSTAKGQQPSPYKDTVYGKNYDNLLKVIPDLHNLKPGDHFRLLTRGFMPLTVEVRQKFANGDMILSLSHNFLQFGDIMDDPYMEIKVFAKGGVEALSFQQSPNIYEEVYPEPGKTNIRAKKSQNDFLRLWLRNLKNQGFGDSRKYSFDEAPLMESGGYNETYFNNAMRTNVANTNAKPPELPKTSENRDIIDKDMDDIINKMLDGLDNQDFQIIGRKGKPAKTYGEVRGNAGELPANGNLGFPIDKWVEHIKKGKEGKTKTVEYAGQEFQVHYQLKPGKKIPAQIQTLANDLVNKFIDKKIVKIKDILDTVKAKYGDETLSKLFPALKAGYSAYLMNADEMELKGMDSFDDVRKLTYEDYAKLEPEGETKLPEATNNQDKLVDTIYDKLFNKNETIKDNPALNEIAKEVLGGSRAQGSFSSQDLYNALETAINKWIANNSERLMNMPEKDALTELRNILTKIPTQTVRTGEKDLLQQFSTPPTLAYFTNKLLNSNPDDIILEPSAGNGGLIAFQEGRVKDIYTNEIDDNRRAMLEYLGFKTANVNAEYLNSTLDQTIRPTKIIMNPPFSATGGRVQNNNNKFGYRHIFEALARLPEGGRLVAILGEGAGFTKPKAQELFWRKAIDKYNVRADIGISNNDYGKYGTSFGNRVIVIDKTPPQNKRPEVIGDYQTIEEALNASRKIISDTPTAISDNSGSVRLPAGQQGGRPSGTGGQGISGERPGSVGDRTPHTSQSGKGNKGNSSTKEPDTNGPKPIQGPMEESQQGSIQPSTVNPPFQPASDPAAIDFEAVDLRDRETESSGFVEYAPKLKFKGSQKHPGKLVESASMASVEVPSVTYKPHIPEEIIKEGKLSEAQLEIVMLAGNRHNTFLKNGHRGGIFVGNGTGTGKGRAIAGIILDNWHQGNKKALWVSASQDLINDAIRDITGIGADLPIQILNDVNIWDEIPKDFDGIIFCNYDTFRMSSQDPKTGKERRRLDQIVKWLNKDSVVVFDEAHKAKNMIPQLRQEPSINAQRVAELQDDLLPNARIVYSSATGATDVRHMAYMSRLGLWGEGTPFANFIDFMQKIEHGGLGAMEMVARDMKALGLYTAQMLSYDGVEYTQSLHTLTDTQRIMYNTAARAWQHVISEIDRALEVTNGDSNVKKYAYQQFWTTQQRFFRQVITSMKVPTLIQKVEDALANNMSVIIDLVSTNEAMTARAVNKQFSAGESLDDLDLTPREMLATLLEKAFPIYQFTEHTDPNTGKVIKELLTDAEGHPIINEEMRQQRDRLIDSLSQLNLPENPLDQIINYFELKSHNTGDRTLRVAELTGRKRRLVKEIVRNSDPSSPDKFMFGSGIKYAKRVDDVAMKKANQFEMQQYQGGQKRIAMISDATATGFTLSSDKNAKNQQRRYHITFETGWSADKQMQHFGRSHRSNQASAPIYDLLSSDIGGEKRFLSTIAKRLAGLGALTRGERSASGAGNDLAKYDFYNEYGKAAMVTLMDQMFDNDEIPGIASGFDALEKMGLITYDKQTGIPSIKDSDKENIERFLNRILILEVDEQNAVFDAFFQTFENLIQMAKDNGTFDEGAADLKGESITIKREPKTVYIDPATGAETKHYVIDLETKTNPLSYKTATEYLNNQPEKRGFYQNTKSKFVYFKMSEVSRTDPATGQVQVKVVLHNPQNSKMYIDRNELTSKFTRLTPEEAKPIWEAKYNSVPPTVHEDVNIIAGAILPLYNQIQPTRGNQTLKVIRVTTNDKTRIVGVRIPNDKINDVLRSLNIAIDIKTPKDIFDAVLQGEKVPLSQGFIFKRSALDGEPAIELSSTNELGIQPERWDELKKLGLEFAKISFKGRFFVPTDETKGIEIIKNIIDRYPPIKVADNPSDFSLIGRVFGRNKNYYDLNGNKIPLFYNDWHELKLDNPYFDRMQIYVGGDIDVIWSREKIIFHDYVPELFSDSLLKPGDEGYEEGKELYSLTIQGRNNSDAEGNGSIYLSTKGNAATYAEELVHCIQRQIERISPKVARAIREWEKDVRELAELGGVKIPGGLELFAKSYVALHLGYHNAAPEFEELYEIPKQLGDAFDAILNQSKSGRIAPIEQLKVKHNRIRPIAYQPLSKLRRQLGDFTRGIIGANEINYSLTGRPPNKQNFAPAFFSKMQQVLDSKLPNSFSSKQAMDIIRSGEIKEAEVKWSGIEDWLLANRDKKLTKDDLNNFLNKYGKKWGAKVGEVSFKTGEKRLALTFKEWLKENGYDDSPQNIEKHYQKNGDPLWEGWKKNGYIDKVETVHSLDITPEMKQSVLYEGQPLFSIKGKKPIPDAGNHPPLDAENARLEGREPTDAERMDGNVVDFGIGLGQVFSKMGDSFQNLAYNKKIEKEWGIEQDPQYKRYYRKFLTAPQWFFDKEPQLQIVWDIIDKHFVRDLNEDSAILKEDKWQNGKPWRKLNDESKVNIANELKKYETELYQAQKDQEPMPYVTYEQFANRLQSPEAREFIMNVFRPTVQQSLDFIKDVDRYLIIHNTASNPFLEDLRGVPKDERLKMLELYKQEFFDAVPAAEGAYENAIIELKDQRYKGDIEVEALERAWRDNSNVREQAAEYLVERKFEKYEDKMYFPSSRLDKKYFLYAVKKPTEQGRLLQGETDDKMFITDDRAWYLDNKKNELETEGYEVQTGKFKEAQEGILNNAISQEDLLDLVALSGIDTENPVVDRLLKSVLGKGFTKHFIPKKFIPGFQYTAENFETAMYKYIGSVPYYKNRTIGRLQLDKHLASLKKRKILKPGSANDEYLQNLRNMVESRDRAVAQALRAATSVAYLSLRPSYLVQQIVQPLNTLMPLLPIVAKELGLNQIEAEKAFVESMLSSVIYYSWKIADKISRMKTGKGLNNDFGLGDEFIRVIKRLERQGVGKPLRSLEIVGEQVDPSKYYNPNPIAEGTSSFAKFVGLPGIFVEDFTRAQGIRAFYLLGKKAGLKGEKLLAFISKQVAKSYGPASGRLSKPSGYYVEGKHTISKGFRTAVDSHTTFMNFVFMNFGQWGKTFRTIGQDHLLRPLIYKLAAQVGIAGFRYMMWVSTVLTLLSGIYAMLKIPKDPEEQYESLFKPLNNVVPGMGDALYKGLASITFNVDLTALFSQQAPFFSENIEFNQDLSDVIGGAPFKLVKDIATGIVKQDATKVVPQGIRNIIKANEYEERGVNAGRKNLIPKEKVTPDMKLKKQLGFTPMEVSDAYTNERRRAFKSSIVGNIIRNRVDSKIIDLINDHKNETAKHEFIKLMNELPTEEVYTEGQKKKIKDVGDFVSQFVISRLEEPNRTIVKDWKDKFLKGYTNPRTISRSLDRGVSREITR